MLNRFRDQRVPNPVINGFTLSSLQNKVYSNSVNLDEENQIQNVDCKYVTLDNIKHLDKMN